MSNSKAVKKTAKKSDETSNSKSKTKPAQHKAQATNGTTKPKSLSIKLDELVPFEDHPYKVLDNE